ncbi:MAG TPA: peptide ABC transporter substrate-binding protein [Candidatus Limnocylindria bacterium]|jgi:oligopeptide transport system substrate-binding protein|nr:peptide ABC transporter substrate-binding protein [Candidatus Limnocylindria bacterium]
MAQQEEERMTKRRTGIWSVVALLAIASLLVSACSQAPSGQGTTGGTQGQADPNGELTINTGSEPDTIDPQKSSFVNEIAQAAFVFEGLMTFDPKTTKPIPAAAAAAPKVSSDGLKYTYTVKDGLKYSDGAPLTAKNFEYSFLRGCDPNAAGDYAFVLYVVVGCEAWNTMDTKKATPAELAAAKAKVGIKATSDKDIEFTLTQPAPYFVPISALWIGWPVRESDVQKGGDKWTEPATYIGNGPFKLTEWKHNEKFVFERNDNYRKKIQIKKITKVMINESAVAFAAYRNNELDLVGIGPTDLRTVEGDAELKAQMVDTGGSCTFYYGYNVRRPPFDDINIRQAFSKAFDRSAFVKDVQQGIGKAADGGFIPPGFPGYDNTDTDQKYDPAAAKALLDKASPASKAGLTGLKYTFSSSNTNKARAEWAQGQFKTNLGVTVELDPVQSTAYSALFKKGQDSPQLFFLGWCADFPDQQNWHSTVWATGGISAARTGYSSKAFDDLTKQADKEADAKKRDDLYNQAGKQLTKDAPAAWVYYDAGKRLQKPWLKGVTDNPIDYGIPGYFALENIYVVKH